MRFFFTFALIGIGGCVGSPIKAQSGATNVTGDSVTTDFIKDCDVCPELAVVPAGRFMMGSPQDEAARGDGEDDQEGRGGSQVPVAIDYSFAVGRTEVTWDDWEACVAEGGCDGASVEEAGGAEGWGKGNRPVVNVSWIDAKDYAAWLSKKTGKGYRLLTEAEWEYAARAGTTTRYSFGDDISKDELNYKTSRSVPVGSYEPNGFGLYDVHGNVWEWVEDCYTSSYADNPRDGSAVAVEEDCRRVLRGGAWQSSVPQFLRAAVRFRYAPVIRSGSIGFRIARTVD